MQITRVTLLGAGVLGGQIAWQSAFKGKTVVVYDLYKSSLEQCRQAQQGYAGIYTASLGASADAITATRSRLTFTTDLATAAAGADLEVESVDRRLARGLFKIEPMIVARPARIISFDIEHRPLGNPAHGGFVLHRQCLVDSVGWEFWGPKRHDGGKSGSRQRPKLVHFLGGRLSAITGHRSEEYAT